MSSKNIQFYNFLYSLSKNFVPNRSKFKKDKTIKELKKVKCIYKNPRPEKIESQESNCNS